MNEWNAAAVVAFQSDHAVDWPKNAKIGSMDTNTVETSTKFTSGNVVGRTGVMATPLLYSNISYTCYFTFWRSYHFAIKSGFWCNAPQNEVSRLSEELTQASAQRDEIGIKYSAVCERVGNSLHTYMHTIQIQMQSWL